MHTCVLGAGIIGVTTAYQLLLDGHEVTLIDARDQAGQMTSFGNGAQLSYSYVAPLADASIWRKWPSYLFDSDSPFTLRPEWDLAQWRWLAQFLWASRSERAAQTSLDLLKISYFSQTVMGNWTKNNAFQFAHRTAGKLVMMSDQASLDSAAKQIALQAAHGSVQSVLDIAQCVALEPALGHAQNSWLGGVYTASEEVGDCAAFCQELMRLMLQSEKFQFLAGSTVTDVRINLKENLLAAVQLQSKQEMSWFSADYFVVALGAESAHFAKKLGFNLPIYPLKGYSITVPVCSDAREDAPHISITDLSQKVVYARLGNQLRVAGRVELVGNDLRVDAKAITQLTQATQRLFPQCGDLSEPSSLSPWAGLRPATPTGLPIIGTSPIRNVYLNVGHGALGWTLACGSAALLSSILNQENSAIDARLFAFS